MSRSNVVVQHTLFDVPISDKVVNVSSVPQRSPFRYPGGKTWMIPRIRRWLQSLEKKPALLVEPFAGGASVGLTGAFEKLAERVLLVELDVDVAAVWQTILSEENEWLASRILAFDVTEENVKREMSTEPKNTRDRAFKTILKNRTFHGGILAAGSAPIRFGENGKGIKSRWYPDTLAHRIRSIHTVRERIEIVCGDGLASIREHSNRKDVVFFIDPPYTAAGKRAGARLYTHHTMDHEALFEATGKIQGDFLMTYDVADDLVSMASRRGFQTKNISMKNTHHAVMDELLIGRNLDWVV